MASSFLHDGRIAAEHALALRAAGLEIEDRVYLCDTWRGVVKADEIDVYYYDGKHDDAARSGVERLLSDLGVSNVELLEGIFPEETGARISEQTIRLCHCDVDVYRSARDVLDWVWPRLVSAFPSLPGLVLNVLVHTPAASPRPENVQ